MNAPIVISPSFEEDIVVEIAGHRVIVRCILNALPADAVALAARAEELMEFAREKVAAGSGQPSATRRH